MDKLAKDPLRIGDWLVEPDLDQLSAHGQVHKLEPRVMRLLLCLAEHPGEVVPVDRLLEQVWSGVVVTPSSIYQGIAELRRILGDDARQPRYIVNVPRKGYRLVIPMSGGRGTGDVLLPSEASGPPIVADLGGVPVPLRRLEGSEVDRRQRPRFEGQSVHATWLAAALAVAAVAVGYLTPGRVQKAVVEPSHAPVVILEVTQDPMPSAEGAFLAATLKSSVTAILGRAGIVAIPPGPDAPGAARLHLRQRLHESGSDVEVDLELTESQGTTAQDVSTVHLRRPLMQALDLADDIVRAVFGRLGISSARVPSSASIRSTKARGLYVEGQYLWLRNTGQDLDQSLQRLRASIEIDPNDAEVWATLSRVYANRSDSMAVNRDEAYASARVAAEKAIALDPKLASGHVALAHVLWAVEWEWSGAEREIQIALQLEPNQLEALHIAGDIEKTLGHWNNAIALYTRGIGIDPLHGSAYSAAGPLACAGRVADAEATWRRLISVHPDYGGAHAGLARLMSSRGRHEDAVAELRAEREPAFRRVAAPAILLSAGKAAAGRQALDELLSHPKDDVRLYIAEAFAALGERDAAFRWLELAVKSREVNLAFIKADPMLVGLARDPRWNRLLRRIGLPTDGRCNLEA